MTDPSATGPETDGADANDADRLRAAGLRSTPQRRAILSTFTGGVTEHLSADDIFARVNGVLPGVGRGTVYATLAEFTEVGLLDAFGDQEPVRYEINTSDHAHFRCERCMRIFDVDAPRPSPAPFLAFGRMVKAISVVAEGLCHHCEDFAEGLRLGAADILETPVCTETDDLLGSSTLETPLGPIALGATNSGVVRLAFDDHADYEHLVGLGGRRRAEAQTHLRQAATQLDDFFDRKLDTPTCTVDWDNLAGSAALRTIMSIPFGSRRSYHLLSSELSFLELGRAVGANPLPVFIPCHRIVSGTTVPSSFVGGSVRRQWLSDREEVSPRAADQ